MYAFKLIVNISLNINGILEIVVVVVLYMYLNTQLIFLIGSYSYALKFLIPPRLRVRNLKKKDF